MIDWFQVHGRHSWVLWAVGLTMVLALCGLGAWMWRDAAVARQAVTAEFERQRQADGAGPGESTAQAVAAIAQRDFTRLLPESPQAETLATELQRATRAAGVRIVSMQFQDQPARADQLGRSDVALSLKGSYPQLKQVVGETLARFPNATLRRMSLRQMPPAPEADASVVIAVWGRPGGTDVRNASGPR